MFLCSLRDDAVVHILLRGRETYVRGIVYQRKINLVDVFLLKKKYIYIYIWMLYDVRHQSANKLRSFNFSEHGHSQRGVPLRVVQFTSQGREITDNYYVPSESITVETYSRQILLVYRNVIHPRE